MEIDLGVILRGQDGGRSRLAVGTIRGIGRHKAAPFCGASTLVLTPGKALDGRRLVAFATWGYSYAFSPALRFVLEQLRHPNDEIIGRFKLENRASPRTTRFIIYIREPRELEGVAVGMGQHIVLLPADARDTTIYDRLDRALNANSNISLTGDTYYWPTSPTHSIDIVAFNSVLVLPTPGDVRMLS